jgi:hypothetical protein
MTGKARFTQGDYKRATMAAVDISNRTGKPARVIFRLEKGEIEIIVGCEIHRHEGQNPFDEA